MDGKGTGRGIEVDREGKEIGNVGQRGKWIKGVRCKIMAKAMEGGKRMK